MLAHGLDVCRGLWRKRRILPCPEASRRTTTLGVARLSPKTGVLQMASHL